MGSSAELNWIEMISDQRILAQSPLLDYKLWSQNQSAKPKIVALEWLTVLWKFSSEGEITQRCLKNTILIYLLELQYIYSGTKIFPLPNGGTVYNLVVNHKQLCLGGFHTASRWRVTSCWLSNIKEIGLTTCGHLQHYQLAVGGESRIQHSLTLYFGVTFPRKINKEVQRFEQKSVYFHLLHSYALLCVSLPQIANKTQWRL